MGGRSSAGSETFRAVCHDILDFFARVLVILLGSTRESRHHQVMATTTRFQRKYDHRLRELVRATGNIEVALGAVERLVAFYVQEHNTRLPHSAFRGQTPDEMYLISGKPFPKSWQRLGRRHVRHA